MGVGEEVVEGMDGEGVEGVDEEAVEGVDEEVVEGVDWLVDLDLVVGLGWYGIVFGVPYNHCKSDMFDHSEQN
jgi:hypothetical protein